jgi:hypothetical protein
MSEDTMRSLLFLIPVLLTGCFLFGSEGRLPEVWVVKDVPIRFWNKLEPNDDRPPRVVELLTELNRAIYDASDGQIRIAKFTVYDTPQRGPGNLGQGELHDADESIRGHASLGTPRLPGVWHFTLHENEEDLKQRIRTAVHEWFHAYTSIVDEYRREAEGSKASCPEKWVDRQLSNACLMYANPRTELCRPPNHNPKTRQGDRWGKSCYERVIEVVKADGFGQMILPDEHYVGPSNPPDPVVDFVK